MKMRPLGKTGMTVSALGYGTAELGYLGVPQGECDRILGALLDHGLNVIDTASSYMDAEEKVGRAIAARREEFVLVSKGGQAIAETGAPAWSDKAVHQEAERSLRRLRTDHLDLLLLHSCPVAELRNDRMIEALLRLKDAGMTRWIGYSGDGANLSHALGMGVFDCIETSVSLCDQQGIAAQLPEAGRLNLGVLTKRSVANSCWRDLGKDAAFYSEYAEPYAKRLRAMGLSPESVGFDGSWMELALRFTAFQAHVHVALVGGRTLEHLLEDIRILDQGPLPEEVVRALRDRWKEHDDGTWVGQT